LATLDPEHHLAILTLNMGDLFLTKANDHGRLPVIGFFDNLEQSISITRYGGRTAFFKTVEEETVGIYFRKNVQNVKSGYWSRFHEVWIGGKLCVIHEQFIFPLKKGKKKDE
jgi:hypothetical protein